MRTQRIIMFAAIAAIALGAGIAAAQETTYEIRQGEVVHVYGNNLVVKMADGETREVDVPEGFMFTVDGKQVPISQLTPGTKLTATIKTTTVPEIVKTTEIRNAEVVQRQGRNLIVRDEKGKLKMYKQVPEDIVITRRGEVVPFESVAGGQKITAVIVHKEMVEVTEQDIAVYGEKPAAPAKPAPVPVAAPAPKPAPAPVLPKTASFKPVVGLIGLLALAIGLGIAVFRRI
jgi:hypothetical protein